MADPHTEAKYKQSISDILDHIHSLRLLGLIYHFVRSLYSPINPQTGSMEYHAPALLFVGIYWYVVAGITTK